MEVDEDGIRPSLEPAGFKLAIHRGKRIVKIRHEHAALRIDHEHVGTVRRFEVSCAATRRSRRIVDRPEQAFLTIIREDGVSRNALYIVNPDNSLSLVIKGGMTTPLGKVTNTGVGSNSICAGLNNKGQVAVALKIDTQPVTLVLLTPNPAPTAGQ